MRNFCQLELLYKRSNLYSTYILYYTSYIQYLMPLLLFLNDIDNLEWLKNPRLNKYKLSFLNNNLCYKWRIQVTKLHHTDSLGSLERFKNQLISNMFLNNLENIQINKFNKEPN